MSNKTKFCPKCKDATNHFEKETNAGGRTICLILGLLIWPLLLVWIFMILFPSKEYICEKCGCNNE